MTATPQIQRDVVGGVAVRWIEAPPPLVATLMFRVGPIDERLKTSGITHLTEHLALDPLRHRDHAFNGAVHVDHTAFWAAGEPAQVAMFLRQLCHSLTDLPTDRLEAEARVLAAESQALTGSNYTDLLRTWYGPNGPGLIGSPEYGLEWVGPTHVGAWAAGHFTAANAMLTLTGPPPAELTLNLPMGTYVPVAMPPEDAGFRPESQVKLRSQPAGVCLGSVALRSVPLVMAVAIIGQRMRERLRHDLGLVYSVQASYEPLSADEAFVYIGTDCEPMYNDRVSEAFMSEIREFARAGPTQAELDRAHEEPAPADVNGTMRSELNRLSHDELLGHRVVDQDEAAALRAATTIEAVRDAFAEAIARCLVIPSEDYDEGLTPRPRRSQEPFSGRHHRARRQAHGSISRLVVGDEGVSALAEGRWVSIGYRDLALVTRPAAGIRHLFSRQGGWIELDATAWWRGDRIIQALDSHLPPETFLPMVRGRPGADMSGEGGGRFRRRH